MTRIQGDRYYTPTKIYEWLQSKLQLTEQKIFDPCCGQDHPTNAAFGFNNPVFENDIDIEVGTASSFDARIQLIWETLPSIDWVITNPPYTQPPLDEIIRNSLEYSDIGVAMLLRLSYLEPCPNRRDILAGKVGQNKELLAVYPVNPRPKFDPSKKGTDSSTVGWFIWGNRKKLIEIPPFDFCVDWR